MGDALPNRFRFSGQLDTAFLEELFDGDMMYAEMVFADFLQDLTPYWQEVQDAFDSGNIQALRAAVHKCKTLFGYVGCTNVQQQFQAYENDCSAIQTIAALQPGFEQLMQIKTATRSLIERELRRLKLFNSTTET